MSDSRDLPEGVINADPPGGFEDVDDTETAEQNARAVDSPSLSESRLAPNTPDGADAVADVPVETVQSAEPSQAGDPDLSARDGSEEP